MPAKTQNTANIRFVTPADTETLLAIYGQYIDTPVTFEYTLPAPETFAARIAAISSVWPWLVCEENGTVTGYAYAHRLMEREAYQWNAGLSVYLDTASRSKGRGTALYRPLIDMLVLQNIRTVFGIVTLPNAASERLHESLGFSRTGLYRNTGYKCGKWHDVVWFEKTIAPHTPAPIPFIPIGKIAAGQLAAIQQKYRQTLR